MRQRQQGMGTLLIAVVFLIASLLMTLYLNRGTLTEQILSSNVYRHKQALEAAQAALEMGIHYYQTGGVDRNADGVPDTVSVPLTGQQASVQFCAPESTVSNCIAPTPPFNRLLIVGTGRSDDDMAVRRVAVLASSEGVLRVNPRATLTAKGSATATLNGNLTVINNIGSTTIWTGTDISKATGSFETKITINGASNQVSSAKNGNQFYVGPDVIYNDHTLRNMSVDDFVQQMTGRTMSEFAAMADITVTNSQPLPAPTSENDFHGNKVIYVNRSSFDPNANLGTATKPVILVVNGDFEINAQTTINGIVIAKRLTKANGNARINGALIVENVEGANGGFTIEMLPSVITNLDNLVIRSIVANSWRDWN